MKGLKDRYGQEVIKCHETLFKDAAEIKNTFCKVAQAGQLKVASN
jgi:hypothetical protein